MVENKEIYSKVGQVLYLIQMWEEELKKVTIINHIVESDDKRSLSNMNAFLLRKAVLTEEQFLLMRKVIDVRNFVIHRLYLDLNDEDKMIDKLNEMIDLINTTRNILINLL